MIDLKKWETQNEGLTTCNHCWHPFAGAIWMVIRPGFILQECCECGAHRQVHAAHAHDSFRWPGIAKTRFSCSVA